MRRIVAPGGLLITLTPWIWRYHPYPFDFQRYTHTGMRYPFERRGGVRTLHTSYAEKGKTTISLYRDKSDQPPSNAQAPTQIHLFWVGIREDEREFDPSSLNASSDFDKAALPSGLPA